MGKRRNATPFDILMRLFMLACTLSVLFPLAWIVVKSLETNQEFFMDAWSFPKTVMLGNYLKAWNNLGIAQSMLNTIYYVGASLALGLFITALASFVLTRLEFRGRKAVIAIVMFSLFLPGINALVPLYTLMRTLHLINKISGLVLVNGIGGNAFALLILMGFMQSIPKELEESVYIDGGSLFKSFWHIILPLSVPGLVTVAVFNFLGLYNDFLMPFIYLDDPKNYTIGVNMYNANSLMQFKADWVTLCAGVVISMVPPVAVFIAFQKQVMQGVTVGALKG